MKIDFSKIESYTPKEDVREFILDAYSDFEDCRDEKLEPQSLLGGINLESFWNDSNYDYGVLTGETSVNDPIKPYASSISRDKSNDFIASLTTQLILPSVVAQNQDQEIDTLISKVSKSLLEWAHLNDGRPSSSGHKKTVSYVHKMVIEGTVHVQDDIVDNRLESQIVPNEEVFIPNFWQTDIQKQPFLMRVQNKVHYLEALREFGDLENFKYVKPGHVNDWNIDEDALFKEYGEGLSEENEVQIIRIWRDIPKSEFKKYKVPGGKSAKRAKLFNILINGVLMFPVDNLSPYRDGFYPISKEIYEPFSKAEYYWGNSMPNKAKKDKEFLDGWKTLIRHKAKLAAIPPLITLNGQHVDSDIFLPGHITQAPTGMKPEDIIQVPGMNLNGVNNSDLAVLQDAKNEIDEGNISPQASGKAKDGVGTATEAIILEQNEQKILGAFGLRVAFLIEQRTFPILMRLYQFLPRSEIKKIAIPNQSLGEGKTGSLEVIFEKIPEMDEEKQMQISRGIFQEEQKAEQRGKPKKIVFINPKYIRQLDMYIIATTEVKPKPSNALRRAEAMEKYQIYSQNPQLFNTKAAARSLVRALGDDETEMINEQQPQEVPPEMMEGMGQQQMQPSMSPQPQRQAEKQGIGQMSKPKGINI